MADDSDTGSPPDAGRPKRPPPTIELNAAEVVDRPAAGESPEPESLVPESLVPETPAESAETAPSGEPEPAVAPAEPAIQDAAQPPRARPSQAIPAVAGAVAGAIVAGAVAAAAWFGLGHATPADTSDIDAVAARVAQIEARQAPAPDPSLVTRIDALETSVAALRGDLASVKTQSDRLTADVNQFKAAPRAAATTVDLGPVNARLDQVERAVDDLKSQELKSEELKSETAQRDAKPANDMALRRVVAAALLDMTVRQGEPYGSALASVKSLGGDTGRLKPLDRFAATGIPDPAALSRDLLAVLPKLAPVPAESPATGSGLLDRLEASAARLVRIERTDAAAAGNRGGAVSRAAAAARSHDIAAARQALSTLAPADRPPVQPWLDQVDARDAALAASRQFAADAMAALSKPAP